MRSTSWTLIGTAAGATAMYLLDPVLGRRRRALVRDKLTSAALRTADVARPAARDVRNRAYGTFAEARSFLRPDEEIADGKLLRVRAFFDVYAAAMALGVLAERSRS